MNQKFTRFVHIKMVAHAVGFMLLLPFAAQAQRYVDPANSCGGNLPCYTTISAAVAAASAGETIFLTADVTEGKVVLNKAITLDGQGFTLNSISNDHGLVLNASGITVQNITVQQAGTFGVITGAGRSNLTLSNVTARNNGRLVPINGISGSGFAITGVSNVTMTNITALSNRGNGVSITAAQNVTITGLTTAGNAFWYGFSSGVGVFSSPSYTPCTTNNINIGGVLNIAEQGLVYHEDNEADACTFPNITNVSVAAPAAFFAAPCNGSSDAVWARNLTDAANHAGGLALTNTAYSTGEMYIRDLGSGLYYNDGAGPNFDPVGPSSTFCGTTVDPPTTCGPNDVAPEISFAINSVPVGNINNGTVDQTESITISVCDTDDNVSCAPFPVEVVNQNSLPLGVSVGMALDFTTSNVTINGFPFVDFQTCVDDFNNGLLMMLFEPSSIRLIDPLQDGSVQLVITPFSDTNGNCMLDEGECTGDPITITIYIIAFLEDCPLPTIDNQGGPTITDPCTCSATPGYFDEEIVITSNTGEVWILASNTGLLDPITLQPFPVGTLFTETAPGSGIYTLVGSHASGVGFIATATSIAWPNVTLGINNLCFYPEPQITTALPAVVCPSDAPIVLMGTELLTNGMQGIGTFFINSNPAPVNGNGDPIFDPSLYTLGLQTVTFTWDAGDPANPNTGVGCTASVSASILIINAGDIIANDATWTVPECSNDVTFCYSFNIELCNDATFDPTLLLVNFGDLNDNIISFYTESAGSNLQFVEYCFRVSPADGDNYIININYGGIDVSPILSIITKPSENTPFIVVTNTNPTLTACAECENVLIGVFVNSCDNILDPSRLIFIDQNGNMLTPSFVDVTNAYAEYSVLACQADVNANPDFNFFIITYTDALGNS
ncbi:MAG TPA: right-handed parallel beta-helix repeat-containing protein, partial [Saprospiraceae bacterium]|nr:right-handed parallel beta-helix repeat-containing protein [Saprospiraceae bacterium]